MISAGDFRLDLYYRISGVTIRLPSLRERLEDIPELVEKFLSTFASRHNMATKGVDRRVYGYLRELPWPGNVRQLLHEVEKAAIFCEGPEITVQNFRPLPAHSELATVLEVPHIEPSGGTLQAAVADMERVMIRNALQKHKGNKKRVAEELGISRAYLYKKLPDAS
jgi:DNA-binding NtrC family response regulator